MNTSFFDHTIMDRPPHISTTPMALWPVLMEQHPDGIVMVDRVDGVLLFNRQAERILGVKQEELLPSIESRVIQAIALDASSPKARPLQNLWSGDFVATDAGVHAVRVPGADRARWLEWRVSPIVDAARGIDGVLLLLREVERAHTDHLYRRLFEAHAEAMLVLDPSTSKIIDINRAAATVFSLPGASLRGQRLSTIFEDRVRVKSLLEPAYGACVKLTLRQGTASERSLEICSTPFDVDGQPRVFAIMHDVTEHEHLHEQMRTAQAISHVGVFEVDLLTQETTWSDEFYTLHGFPKDLQPNQHHIISRVHPEDQAQVSDRIKNFLATHEPLEGRYRVLLEDGQERVLAVRGEPVRDEVGQVVRLVGTTQDVSEHLRLAEGLRAYTAELEQSNRALEDFAYVASHDLQEPLRKIMAFSDRLSQRYKDVLDDRGLQYLDRMHGAAGRMKSLIEDLLELSRVSTHPRCVELLSPRSLLEDVLEDLEVRIEQSRAHVQVNVEGMVPGDASQLRQLMLNLIGNALKFHKPEQAPRVHVTGTTSVCGELYELAIRDQGLGMRADDVEAIFEPFRRLHGRSSKYEGTGIGLALCHKIVERHTGAIRAESAPGEGTTFFVTLPMNTRELSGCMGGCLGQKRL